MLFYINMLGGNMNIGSIRMHPKGYRCTEEKPQYCIVCNPNAQLINDEGWALIEQRRNCKTAQEVYEFYNTSQGNLYVALMYDWGWHQLCNEIKNDLDVLKEEEPELYRKLYVN